MTATTLITAIDADQIFSATSAKYWECNTRMSAVFGHHCSLLSVRTCQCSNRVLNINCYNVVGTYYLKLNDLDQSESQSKDLNLFCIWERLFRPNDIDAFYHTEVKLRCWIITMRFKCWIFNYHILAVGVNNPSKYSKRTTLFFYLIILRCFRFHLLSSSEDIFSFLPILSLI